MASFSPISRQRLDSCDPVLRVIMDEAIEHFDFAVTCGHRGEQEQNVAYDAGVSTKRWPKSKHNTMPSLAVDIAPYPIDWKNRERFILLAGIVMGIAVSHGYKLRWGGDWRGTQDPARNKREERPHDLPHFELVL